MIKMPLKHITPLDRLIVFQNVLTKNIIYIFPIAQEIYCTNTTSRNDNVLCIIKHFKLFSANVFKDENLL